MTGPEKEQAPNPVLEVRDLAVHYPLRGRRGTVRAVDGVDLQVHAGSTLGLVGESGCGKSTLGRAVLRLAPVTRGEVLLDGEDLAALRGEALRRRRRDLQMVFQDPLASLNPRQSVDTILTEPMRAHRLPVGPGRVAELLDQVGLPASAARRYPHEFSGGQRQRIGIARALALEPRVVIADEPVSALDVSIQAQVLNLLAELQERLGLTYLVIAHDLAVVRHVSDVVAVMYLGGIVEQADADALYDQPLHPYTRGLMSAVPVPDPLVEDARERILLRGDLPSPASPPSGCRFHTRCPFVQEARCRDERPLLRPVPAPRASGASGARPPSGDHLVACHYVEEIEAGSIVARTDPVAAGA
ncbi:ATP-binding cassette domain-containing protein [Nocardioides zeae]|uniref:ATP-binding cassette domain-containing protein n=1 Tax=Nocardioides imazamoxiresistens TaxID=3231893 RepID=A0ABU3PSV8_9ACTN|nr:oligopeptide/dipeptide ABC transporter ATP-binding protein [Nocardioides zeae]MDT9592312.1 ATP-binding cassette domain-containing protein [Nocardioides zeae]